MNKLTPIICLILCRVSSKEQDVEGYSLAAQEKLLREYAGRHDYEIVKVFSISESASGRKQRKLFNEMLAYLRKHNIKILLVEKTDRLTRAIKDAVSVNDWIEEDEERQVHFVKENFVLHKNSKSNEKFIWNVKVSVAQYYTDNLSEEVKKGQKEKLSQGWLPTKPPLGYKTVGEKGHKIHMIDPEKAPFIRRMFELYATGLYSIVKLTKMMFDDGLRNESGRPVPKSRVHELLINPFYIGKNQWNGSSFEGHQEPLISEELFNKVQKLLKSKTTPKYSKHTYLFSGLTKCGECGGSVTWEVQKGNVYGHCNHYRNCSQKIWSKEPEIESYLLKGFDALKVKNKRLMEWIRKALKEVHKEEVGYYQNSINEINKREEQIKQRLSKLYDDKVDGLITQDFYTEKSNQYLEERKALERTKQLHNQRDQKFYELGEAFYDLANRASEIYQKCELDKKRRLIKVVFSKLLIREGNLFYAYTKPFELLHSLTYQTNSSKQTQSTEHLREIFELDSFIVGKGRNDGSLKGYPSWLRR